MEIRKSHTNDAPQLSKLILETVIENKEDDFDDEGWNRFAKAIEVDEIARRINSADYQIYVTEIDNEIVGIISILHNQKIDQLFVSKQHRRCGIASALWSHAKSAAEKNGGDGSFWVRSSTIGVPLYLSFGFEIVGSRQTLQGISFQVLKYDQCTDQ